MYSLRLAPMNCVLLVAQTECIFYVSQEYGFLDQLALSCI